MAQLSLAQRARRDPALLRRALADPGLRSKLPSSMLTVAQRRARATNQANAALGDINTPLSGSNLLGVTKRITEGAYAPQYQELGRQADLTNAREAQSSQRAQSIYDQFSQYLQHAQGAQAAAGAGAVGAIGGINQQQQQELDAAAQQVQAQQAADARVRGTGLDGGGNEAAAARLADARSMAAAQGATRAGMTTANAGAANALLAGIAGATAQQGGEVQSNIRNAATMALQDLASKRAGLDAQKAGTFADVLTKLRQSAIDQNITAQGLGLKTAEAAADAAKADRTYNLQKRKVDLAAADQKYKHDHPKAPAGDLNGDGKMDAKDVELRAKINAKYRKGSGAKDKSGYLPKGQENKAWGRIDKARATLAKSTKNGTPVGPDGAPLSSDRAILDALQAGGLSSREAYIALSMYRHDGRLSGKAARYAKGLGLHLGSRTVIGSGSPTAIKVSGGVGALGTKVGNLIG